MFSQKEPKFPAVTVNTRKTPSSLTDWSVSDNDGRG